MELVTDLMKRIPRNEEVIVPPRLAQHLEKLCKNDNEGLVMHQTKETAK